MCLKWYSSEVTQQSWCLAEEPGRPAAQDGSVDQQRQHLLEVP